MRFFRDALKSKLPTTWDGEVHSIVGIKVEQPSPSRIFLSQPFLTKKEIINPNSYLSIVGSLNYLAVATRPDLSFAVGFLSRFAKSPMTRHWSAIQHVLGYVKAFGCQSLVIKPVMTSLQVTWKRSKSLVYYS
ncbi:uncharacterized protein VP01_3067g2 [Puccinia sorghi]|uniref:Reverse transcriptase Ty1/copia-type domain-containing protein n=1 Tax=Puccinia sorghi TaxID=27349 RepID=A0A0L6V1L5_9BASI|nr:uncharacterized protein VP01_3067g2 [Puccinia sorghi]